MSVEKEVNDIIQARMSGTIKNSSLRKALFEISPKIKKIQEILTDFPERLYKDITGTDILIQFATAQELEQLVRYYCGARLSVHTESYMFNNDIIVFVAFPVVLTENGLHILGGAYASQKKGQSSLEKEALEVESRAIRLALRKVGLRTEDKLKVVKNEDEYKTSTKTKKTLRAKSNIIEKCEKKATVKSAETNTDKIQEAVIAPSIQNEMPERKPPTQGLYVEDIKRELDTIRKKRSLTWDRFIREALGNNLKIFKRNPDAKLLFTKLEGQEKNELYDHYVTNAEEL